MVEATGSKLANVSFEDLAKALDSDPDFREAVLRHLGAAKAGAALGGGGNQVHIETRATFSLDDHKVFDLNGEGLKLTVVAVN